MYPGSRTVPRAVVSGSNRAAAALLLDGFHSHLISFTAPSSPLGEAPLAPPSSSTYLLHDSDGVSLEAVSGYCVCRFIHRTLLAAWPGAHWMLRDVNLVPP